MKKLLCLSLASTILVNCKTNQPSITNHVIEQAHPNLSKQNFEESHPELTGKQSQLNFKPLPLFMPTFQIKNNGEVKMTNVFETMENEIKKNQEKMKNQQVKMLEKMIKNKVNKQKKTRKHIKMTNNQGNMQIQMSYSQQPLVGGDGYDLWNQQLINEQIKNQPLIGGDDHDLWNDILKNRNQLLIGGGDGHDLWNDQLKEQAQNQPLIGGDQHDFWNDQLKIDDFWRPTLLGDDEHDNWQQKTQQVEVIQNKMPLIGGDNHDYLFEKRIEQSHKEKLNSLRKKFFGQKKQKEVQMIENMLLGGQNDIDNHHHDSDIMPGSKKDHEGKKSVDNMLKGIFNFVKEFKNSKNEQRNQINDIEEITNQEIEKETPNNNKPQVLIK